MSTPGPAVRRPAGQAAAARRASGPAASSPAAASQSASALAASAQPASAHRAANQPAANQPGAAPAAATQSAAPEQGQAPAASRPARPSATPSRLRLARGLATGAALLTGIVATGTFDTGGVNATPNVIAAQWEAAERAGTDVAAARLEVARGVAESAAAVPEAERLADPAAFPALLGSAAEWVARSGTSTSGSLVDVAIAGQEALRVAEADPGAGAAGLQEVVTLTDESMAVTDAVADGHAVDLRTGSRSALTAVVGGLATLLLGGLLVWLALLTRRIVNVPLAIATAITAGLTYVSLNPAALPVDYDQRVDAAAQSAQALQDVRVARAAQYAQTLDAGTAADPVDRAADSVRALGEPAVSDAWDVVLDAQADLDDTTGAEGLAVVTASQEGFAEAESALEELADTRLGASVGSVGRPALVTSGLALVLGLVAGALAWTGLTQRLRDYR
ncbi:hypothetical protein [Ornithinimicrobium cerasi]|uniref:hypothetical protein n=1 Tax=Ornithinimicrobium cerasi TaxID=2248773 RepID=UPI000F00F416|nr:hypothetical protein [Ornithinimicrobium cerasi]